MTIEYLMHLTVKLLNFNVKCSFIVPHNLLSTVHHICILDKYTLYIFDKRGC